jgi:Proteasome/cyclosome repeat
MEYERLHEPLPAASAHGTVDRQTIRQAHAYIVAGGCFALGLRYAGTAHQGAKRVCLHFLKHFKAFRWARLCGCMLICVFFCVVRVCACVCVRACACVRVCARACVCADGVCLHAHLTLRCGNALLHAQYHPRKQMYHRHSLRRFNCRLSLSLSCFAPPRTRYAREGSGGMQQVVRRPQRTVLETCMCAAALGLGMIMAGTGDLECLSILRELR